MFLIQCAVLAQLYVKPMKQDIKRLVGILILLQ